MKKHSLVFLLTLFLLVIASTASASLLLEENFDYTAGDLLTAHGWNITGTSVTPYVAVVAGGLDYSNYPSISGNAAGLATSGQDVNKTFTTMTTGSIYCSFLLNITSAQTAGDYLLHFGPSPISTSFFGRVFVKKDGATNNAFIGLVFGSGTGAVTVYSPTSYAWGTTHLVVLKYDIVAGTTNDVVSLFVNPAISATEPAALLISSNGYTGAPADPANIGSIALRQGSASNSAAAKVDGIRVATSWADLFPSTPQAAQATFTPDPGIYTTQIGVELATTTPDATIYYTTNGSTPDNSSNEYIIGDPIYIASTTTVKAIVYAPGLLPSAVSSATYTFPVAASSIQWLRSNYVAGVIYKLTDEVIITLKSATRNAKYIQDATGAILIDDPTGKLPNASYSVGDGITNLTGTVALYGQMQQFTPVFNPGAATSTGSVVLPVDVTISDLNSTYQAKLVRIKNVNVQAGVGDVFGGSPIPSATNYFITDPGYPLGAAVLRTAYVDLNYIGTPIPSTPMNYVGVVLEYNGVMQLVPRSLAEITNPPIVTYGYENGIPSLIVDNVGGNGINDPGNTTVQLFLGVPNPNAPEGSTLINRYYVITPTIDNNLNMTVRFYYLDSELNGADENLLIPYFYNGGTTWSPGVGTITRNTIENWVEISGLTHLSTWSLGEGGDPTLPVELSSFTAILTAQNYVNLSWSTQSETGMSGFYIYRSKNAMLADAEVISPLIPATNTSSEQVYIYQDAEVEDNATYNYWLEATELNSNGTFHGPIIVTIGNGGEVVPPPVIDSKTCIEKVYPNPFNPRTEIAYNLKSDSNVTLVVYNHKGQLIRTLVNDNKISGYHRITWDGNDSNGITCASGIYYVKMQTGNITSTRKLVMMK